MATSSNRTSLSFDPGIGGGASPAPSTADSRLDAALAGMQRGHETAQRAARAEPAAPAPAPAAPRAPADVYREQNPSLPSLKFGPATQLPSGGRSYPPGATVRYRPYTLGESIYAEQSELGMRETYALILKGLECSFDPMTLTLPDVLYLGLVRKIASLGSTKVNVTTTCPYCAGLNRTPIDSSALDFDDLQAPALPIRVQLTFGEHTFSPLTLAAYLDLLDRGLEDSFPALMAAQCTSIPDLDTAIQAMRDLTDADDIALIKHVDELLHHELRPVKITCPQEIGPQPEEGDEPAPTCGKGYPVALDDVSAAFVLPFPGGSANGIRDKVTFG